MRHFLHCRAVSHFVGQAVKLRKLLDRALDGSRIDEIGEPGRGLFLDAIETTGGAIALKCSNVAGESGLGKSQSSLFERKGIACRARSRCVAGAVSDFVGHCRQCTTRVRIPPLGYPHRTAWLPSVSAKLRESDIVA